MSDFKGRQRSSLPASPSSFPPGRSSAGLPPMPGNSPPKESQCPFQTAVLKGKKFFLVLSPKVSLWLPPTHLVSGLPVTQAKATVLPPMPQLSTVSRGTMWVPPALLLFYFIFFF